MVEIYYFWIFLIVDGDCGGDGSLSLMYFFLSWRERDGEDSLGQRTAEDGGGENWIKRKSKN